MKVDSLLVRRDSFRARLSAPELAGEEMTTNFGWNKQINSSKR